MGLIVDLVIILIIVGSILLGYKKGLTKSLLKIFTFLIAIVISIVLFKPISNIIINNTQIDEYIKESIIVQFSKNNENQDVNEKDDKKENTMPEVFNKYIQKELSNATNEVKEVIIEEAAKNIALTIVNVGVLILVYLISQIVLIFIKGIAELMTKVPVIKQCDEFCGGLYGLLRALLILIILFTIISIIAPIISNTGIIDIINSSIIGSFMYNNNIIFNIIF